MTENGLPLMVLCHFDGRVVTADHEAFSLLGGQAAGGEAATIRQVAAKGNCAELVSLFEGFVAEGGASTVAVARCGGGKCEVSLRRLNGFQTQPLVAVEMRDSQTEHQALAEVGRAARRLIHDFKNQ